MKGNVVRRITTNRDCEDECQRRATNFNKKNEKEEKMLRLFKKEDENMECQENRKYYQ